MEIFNVEYVGPIVNPCGSASLVGIASRYRLEGPGSNPGGGRNFLHLSRPALGRIQPPLQWVPALSRG